MQLFVRSRAITSLDVEPSQTVSSVLQQLDVSTL